MNCKNCDANCIKKGKQANGLQRYYCKACKKSQQANYKYAACSPKVIRLIPRLLCNSVGIRGIARVLEIGVNTVVRHITKTVDKIEKPSIPMERESFEMDELRTYVGYKGNEYWVAYALCSQTKEVIDFTVGKRNKRVLRTVVNTLLLSGVKKIKTDKLNIYQTLIPKELHESNAYNINHIERHNLNLRTHLKRISRRTICFNKSVKMLTACLRIYFWGRVA
jgi:insertion element IS1 protein InsB